MAKEKRGRITPKKGVTPPSRSRRDARAERQSILPKRIGPFEKPDPDKPLGQVGKRPSSPRKLFVFFLVYLAAGIASFFTLKGSLAVIVGIVFIGLSLFWLRAAATSYSRLQQRSRPPEPDSD